MPPLSARCCFSFILLQELSSIWRQARYQSLTTPVSVCLRPTLSLFFFSFSFKIIIIGLKRMMSWLQLENRWSGGGYHLHRRTPSNRVLTPYKHDLPFLPDRLSQVLSTNSGRVCWSDLQGLFSVGNGRSCLQWTRGHTQPFNVGALTDGSKGARLF